MTLTPFCWWAQVMYVSAPTTGPLGRASVCPARRPANSASKCSRPAAQPSPGRLASYAVPVRQSTNRQRSCEGACDGVAPAVMLSVSLPLASAAREPPDAGCERRRRARKQTCSQHGSIRQQQLPSSLWTTGSRGDFGGKTHKKDQVFANVVFYHYYYSRKEQMKERNTEKENFCSVLRVESK